METQPSEVSLNNARRILAQIENLRDTTGAPTLRKMWTDGTISYEFTVDEAHSRIRVWGEDLSFTGFLFTYPEAGFWGVGYKKEVPKYKKKPPPKILAGELDWQGVGGKLSWNGLSRYFQYTEGGLGTLKGDAYIPASTVPGYKSTSYIGSYTHTYPSGTSVWQDGSTREHVNAHTGGPDVFCDGKKLCTIGATYPYYIYVTCAAFSPDKSKILIGYVKALMIAGNVVQYIEEFIILPKALATGVIAASDPGVLKVVTIMGHEDVPPGTGLTVPGPDDPIYHPADSFTVEEASHLNGMVTVMWRINASASVGYSERRATRQRLNIVWDDGFEDITVTPEEAAWESQVTAADGDEIIGTTIDNVSWSNFMPLAHKYSCKFCDFDWDTLVEGQIEVESSEAITTVGKSPLRTYGVFTWEGIEVTSVTWTVARSVVLSMGGVVRYQRESKALHTASEDGARAREIMSDNRTLFHWVDLRCDAFSVDVQEIVPYEEIDPFVQTLRPGVIKNITVVGGVAAAGPPAESVMFPTNTFTSGFEEAPFYVTGLGYVEYVENPEFYPSIDSLLNLPLKSFQITFGAGGKLWVPQALPYGMVVPFDTVTKMGPGGVVGSADYKGYLLQRSGHYIHNSGLGVAETGIKVYYLSPTEKRCVWGIANLPSAHLNEAQTYTYGSDDPATAEQLKGVGADGLLLNIYVV
jgi:hypothetical protein